MKLLCIAAATVANTLVEIPPVFQYQGRVAASIRVPVSSVQFFDNPPAGTHTYWVRINKLTGPEGRIRVRYAKLVAFEL